MTRAPRAILGFRELGHSRESLDGQHPTGCRAGGADQEEKDRRESLALLVILEPRETVESASKEPLDQRATTEWLVDLDCRAGLESRAPLELWAPKDPKVPEESLANQASACLDCQETREDAEYQGYQARRARMENAATMATQVFLGGQV